MPAQLPLSDRRDGWPRSCPKIATRSARKLKPPRWTASARPEVLNSETEAVLLALSGKGLSAPQTQSMPNSHSANGHGGLPPQNAPPNKSYDMNGYIQNDMVVTETKKVSDKWKKRLYWMVPLAILCIIAIILFEVYKSDFERWVQPLTNWMKARDSWSWVIPVVVLVILSFPPLFGHEVVNIIVGLVFPLGIGLAIACAGAIIGEALCFVAFKYAFTGWVDRKRAREVKWEATARVCKNAGWKGVLVIRYSIVPPHLANPLFATTGMSFFIYMITVVLSLPKTLVFVALGNPNNSHKSSVKVAKVIAVGVLCIVTIFASLWIRKKINQAKAEIIAERAGQLEGAPATHDVTSKYGPYPAALAQPVYEQTETPLAYPSHASYATYPSQNAYETDQNQTNLQNGSNAIHTSGNDEAYAYPPNGTTAYPSPDEHKHNHV